VQFRQAKAKPAYNYRYTQALSTLSCVDKKDAPAHPLRRNGFRRFLLQAATYRDFNGKETGKVGAYRSPILPVSFHSFSLMICL
jgi:hypothetical protein